MEYNLYAGIGSDFKYVGTIDSTEDQANRKAYNIASEQYDALHKGDLIDEDGTDYSNDAEFKQMYIKGKDSEIMYFSIPKISDSDYGDVIYL